MTNEFILEDRLQKIRQVINEYGEDNFYISYSGGQDSNVLSALIDLALPDNKIPRVYCNTGIEYKAIVDFVKGKVESDDRFIIIHPKVPIKQMLEEQGYPFKSKRHSAYVKQYIKHNGNLDDRLMKCVRNYVGKGTSWSRSKLCPKKLMYQFTPDSTLKISDACCHYLKTGPLDTWKKTNGKLYTISGLMREEGGRRESTKCLALKPDKITLKAFHPLAVITKEWERWFIDKYGVKLPVLYYPPYSFERTGCKGCPFNMKLQKDLDTLKEKLPNEYRQCEIIWKPVYDEYRRIGYRLKGEIYANNKM